jgi:arsenite methyltransferase
MMNDEPRNLNDKWSDWLLSQRHAGDAAYQRVVRGMIERIRDRVLDGAKLEAGMTIADIGTGDGLIAFGAIDRIGDSLKVYLTDVSGPLLRHAEQLSADLGIRRQCTFIEGNAENLNSIDDGTLHVVMTRAVLAYVANKSAAIREFHRVLKPGGHISIAEPIFRDQALELLALTTALRSGPTDGSINFLALLQRWKAAQFPATQEQIGKSPLTNYSERDLVSLAREAGFVDIHLELHIDERPSSICTWEVFLDVSPHPLAPNLRTVLETQFSLEEREVFERTMRPLVESGKTTESDAIVYMTASKPR